MSQIVIWWTARADWNPLTKATGWNVGDVIDVVPDDHVFTDKELNNPEWRILRLPNVSEAVARDLLKADTVLTQPVSHLQRVRRMTFDVTTLSPSIKAGMITTVNATETQLQAAILTKTALVEVADNIFGEGVGPG